MLDKRIKFEPDETFIEDEYGTITFYFTGPKELLPWEDSDAEFATISIECPKEYISGISSSSPTAGGPSILIVLF